MDWSAIQDWLGTAKALTIGGVLFGSMGVAAVLGNFLGAIRDRRAGNTLKKERHETASFTLSTALGLVALLLGFTFSLATDRFDVRRRLVLEEANAIEAAYLRTQSLGEPHRTRMSELLVRYTDNRVALAQAKPERARELLAVDGRLIVDIWAATSAAFDSVKGLDFSSAFVESINQVVELDTARKVARLTRVPAGVFVVLFVCLVAPAIVLGYVTSWSRGRAAPALLLVLFSTVFMLIIDIDRPTSGTILESQWAMEELQKSLSSWPPSSFDRWRVANR